MLKDVKGLIVADPFASVAALGLFIVPFLILLQNAFLGSVALGLYVGQLAGKVNLMLDVCRG